MFGFFGDVDEKDRGGRGESFGSDEGKWWKRDTIILEKYIKLQNMKANTIIRKRNI